MLALLLQPDALASVAAVGPNRRKHTPHKHVQLLGGTRRIEEV
jgi:hypothetical protein